ncbi:MULTISPECIES: L,D-transpeptidase [Pseudovibrio]|uniref:L,D-transpeptidase n=1 Tax=Stappiaceae TaxID=2821832 RepID=UPI0023667760|nr:MULTISPECIES: L,D-transpeptidase [Pseudovibrio]MDD7909048.1 L,D-transpeptidase [Pseudovibrio exalbescens]MDX5593631.1 L,D-transpeptidase [Pseudovibrio sp. SPO723]
MLRLLAIAAILLTAGFAATSSQAASGKFFDPTSKKWVSYGAANYGKSPIKRKMVSYSGPYGPGTIVVNTQERRLYHIYPGGQAMKYGVGVGRDGFQWAGTHRITRKAEWPGWTPPAVMRERERRKGRILPAYMEGGPNNPLGARALYIGSTIYRIHGSNEPWTIGSAVSSGCIRLANEDVIHLYENVRVGSKVVVLR